MAFDDPVHPMMLEIWMETLIAARGRGILRLKAVIWAEGFDTPFVIHGVQHIIDPPIRLARWSGEDRKSRIVIIGCDMPQETLLDSLAALKTRPIVHALKVFGWQCQGVVCLAAAWFLGTDVPASRPRPKGFRFSRDGSASTVWAYHRFALSTADDEESAAQHGVIMTREVIRLWMNRFGMRFAVCIKRD